ncbi:Type 1 glutamine amidotransferase-like domain-containing protein [Embleya sp. NPDC020886]|uniref:Type 1 glutamine amidotransferase-like domain-containing protein n=1 Tax=Embleya sp. NPDC020886 TaxID=3363980 RepID=UPI0037989C13
MTTHLVAMGGGGFSMNEGPSALDRYVLDLAGRPHPRVCFIPTASGDSAGYVDRFLRAFGQLDCKTGELSLFQRTGVDLADMLAEQDVIYVGGGSTANLLALWRLHGLDVALAARAAAGDLVVCGLSAGALCWFEGGITDSFGPELRPLADGLGWAAGSVCPHYDGEAGRRPAYHAAIEAGVLAPGYALDDGAAIHLVDGRVHGFVAERAEAQAYRVEPGVGGVDGVDGVDGVRESALPMVRL